jgi:hypothetical protein
MGIPQPQHRHQHLSHRQTDQSNAACCGSTHDGNFVRTVEAALWSSQNKTQSGVGDVAARKNWLKRLANHDHLPW